MLPEWNQRLLRLARNDTENSARRDASGYHLPTHIAAIILDRPYLEACSLMLEATSNTISERFKQ
jgi:hypothetical protein